MRPTLRTVRLFTAGFLAALLPVLASPRLWTVWVASIGVLLLATGVDALLALPRRRIAIETDTPDMLYVGDEDGLTVRLRARRGAGTALELLADLDANLELQPPRSIVLDEHGAEARISLAALRRGTVEIERLWLRWTGPLGLVQLTHVHPLSLRLPVVPNVRAVRAVALRFLGARELVSGLKVERYVGDGSEFESLREYVPGLDHRAIDWKSSARHRKLLCQEFRAERNHQVVLAIDTGHLMREPLERIPRLDHAINAGLLVSYFSLRGGDRVGLFGFDERVRAFAEPQGGIGNFRRLQTVSSELEYTTAETNYTLGLAELGARLRRRSLVVLFTDFVDSVTAELLIENLDRLARRHLVVFVALRDPTLDGMAAATPRSLGDMVRAVVAGDLSREREVVLRRVVRLGVQLIDAPPSAVSIQLLNRYLDIKRRELV